MVLQKRCLGTLPNQRTCFGGQRSASGALLGVSGLNGARNRPACVFVLAVGFTSGPRAEKNPKHAETADWRCSKLLRNSINNNACPFGRCTATDRTFRSDTGRKLTLSFGGSIESGYFQLAFEMEVTMSSRGVHSKSPVVSCFSSE